MMKKYIALSLIVFISVCFGLSGQESSLPILPVDQVKTGMIGKGKTVFLGSTIDEFEVEILGVLYNYQPNRDMIVARLQGEILEKAGVIQGMSGSPVYVGGRLVGAVAYNVATFAKEAIAGITPIGEMLQIEERTLSRSSFSTPIPVKKYLSLDEIFELNKDFFRVISPSAAQGQSLTPLSIPLVFSGFSSHVFEKAKPYFTQIGFSPLIAGPSGQTLDKVTLPDIRLRAGDPVSVQLITGDMDMSAVGTVTHVDGDKVLAFGHPLYNLGAVDYVMAKAKVLAVIPSLQTSFKMATTDIPVGRFSQDRNSGVFGELGKNPRLIPFNIRLLNDTSDREIKVNIVDDKILTPALVNMVVANAMYVEERAIGDLSLDFRGTVFLDNGMSIPLEDFFSGNYDMSAANLSNLVASVVYYLSNNGFRDLAIHKIDLAIRSYEEMRMATLEKVWVDKYDVSPGERIQVKLYTRNYRGQTMLQEGLFLTAPHLPSGTEFQLIIADSVSLQQIELGQYRTQAFMPRSLDQLIRLLGNLRKNNRIYLKVIGPKPGLFLQGEEMPNLPPTMKSMFSSSRAASSAPTELKTSTLGQYQIPVPFVFQGLAVIPIKIK
jgi:hypothetical protein